LGRKTTQYTIDDSICLPTKKITLKTSVHKACRSLDIYLDKKPSLPHTRDAFKVLLEMIGKNNDNNNNKTTVYDGIVLDSGCGTGRSTKLLARDIYPRHLVIGVDRSFSRLTKTKDNRQSLGADIDGNVDGNDGGNVDGNDDICGDKHDTIAVGDETYCQQISENAYLVRAELVEFWECCIDHGWTTSVSSSDDCIDTYKSDDENNNSINRQNDEADSKVNDTNLKITHHYMLYPNPYPTKKRLMQRWYAHPCFPLILRLNVETMVIRSNWEVYLNEFAAAIEMANDFYYHNNSTNVVENDSVSSCQGPTSSIRNNLALHYLSSAKVGPIERIDKSVALTNFEAKFDNVGESTYELILKKK
jgi:SAM-dependent methyltransferase